MISCKEVSPLVSTGGLAEAPFARRAGVWMHLAMCRHCRAFRRQIQAIARAARALGRDFETEPGSRFESKIVETLRATP
jgi:hypothetical protein